MSENRAGIAVAIQGSPEYLRQEAEGLPSDAERALELCLDLVDPGSDPEQRGNTLDALERLLPALDRDVIAGLLRDPRHGSVRYDLLRACAATWFERECELARRALDGPASSTLRRLFGEHIPREAYADELAVLKVLQPRRILILGSGPCPMSAIVVQDEFPTAAITGVDRSREACELSSRLLAACGYGAVEVNHGDAAETVQAEGFDCVLMALTVGDDETEKRRIIDALRSRADPEATLVARTAAGWGRVLYPSVDIPEIASGAARQTIRSSHQRSVAVPVRLADLQF